MAKLYYVNAVHPADVNKNTEWFMYPGVWTTYILILFFSWLVVLSLFRCTPGTAWTVVNLFHFFVRMFTSRFFFLFLFCFSAQYFQKISVTEIRMLKGMHGDIILIDGIRNEFETEK
ncbi:uncharacterized protein M6B38_281055 [Iris pallida]|uniref:Uncharacterized protein n=1 Tax=Iris pallida TaxID=29817 RepID=A0AAX6HBE0_IRIPA|nr:hypothetical protein M6B38_321875 [Iris pallida]KAJ6846480.1 uncharacterized protein M6B38_281055 [Iris pallida]